MILQLVLMLVQLVLMLVLFSAGIESRKGPRRAAGTEATECRSLQGRHLPLAASLPIYPLLSLLALSVSLLALSASHYLCCYLPTNLSHLYLSLCLLYLSLCLTLSSSATPSLSVHMPEHLSVYRQTRLLRRSE